MGTVRLESINQPLLIFWVPHYLLVLCQISIFFADTVWQLIISPIFLGWLYQVVLHFLNPSWISLHYVRVVVLVPKSHDLSCHFATSPRHRDHHSGTQMEHLFKRTPARSSWVLYNIIYIHTCFPKQKKHDIIWYPRYFIVKSRENPPSFLGFQDPSTSSSLHLSLQNHPGTAQWGWRHLGVQT